MPITSVDFCKDLAPGWASRCCLLTLARRAAPRGPRRRGMLTIDWRGSPEHGCVKNGLERIPCMFLSTAETKWNDVFGVRMTYGASAAGFIRGVRSRNWIASNLVICGDPPRWAAVFGAAATHPAELAAAAFAA